ncbi:protein SHQ1 homolog isoform X2 [Acanthaster planci]|uniref:Protein SHQ1 homolog n=1 Tax=Acanthaster planci TaxID=133434 RepID=A0A8B7XJE8_ACAPL|nr:protein SHQ1 homolog isoform X2 [Acanthaster planci]
MTRGKLTGRLNSSHSSKTKTPYAEELCDIVDVPRPDTAQLIERKEARQAVESEKFDGDHYLADLYQDDSVIEGLLSHKPSWHQEWRTLQAKSKQATNQKEPADKEEPIVLLTEDEKEQMRRLPRRHYLLSSETERSVLLSLVDIIFAYAYNIRTTLSEDSVESAWTICKLSPTLSWLDWFTSLDEMVTVCFRRALCYPLYRHWELTNKVFQDVKKIFALGRRRLLKCLLEVHRVLAADEPHYLLNELYITDYCVWVQTLSHNKITSLTEALKKVKISKSQVDFGLEELEQAAELAIQEDSQGQNDRGAVSSVHQYGYPHILYDGLESGSITQGTKSQAPLKQTECREETRHGNEAASTADLCTSNGSHDCSELGTYQKGDCAPVEDSSVTDVATKMADLKVCWDAGEKPSKSDEEQTRSFVSKEDVSVSLDVWTQRPPSKKIEMYGEDNPTPGSQSQSDSTKEDTDRRKDEESRPIVSGRNEGETEAIDDVTGSDSSLCGMLGCDDSMPVVDISESFLDAEVQHSEASTAGRELVGCDKSKQKHLQSQGPLDAVQTASQLESVTESSGNSESDSSEGSESGESGSASDSNEGSESEPELTKDAEPSGVSDQI